MMFLFPLYFLGALGLAIPLYVHLRNRHVSEPYLFPTLRFLMESKVISHRWRTLLRYVVLALRLLALAALILAFAQPWLIKPLAPRGDAAVLVLDGSASMQVRSAWSTAQRSAAQWLRDHPHTRTAVVTAARQATLAANFEQPPGLQLSLINQLAPTCESTDLEAAVRLADRLLAEQNAAHKTIVLFSDLPTTACKAIHWDTPLSPGITVEPHPTGGEAPANLAVTAVETPRSFWALDQPLTITAIVANFSAQRQDVTVACLDGETQVARRSLGLPANESREVAFELRPQEWASIRGRVKIVAPAADAFPLDDVRYFAIPPRQPTRIVRVASSGDDLFLRTTLEAQDAARPPAKVARYQFRTFAGKMPEALAQAADVIVLEQGEKLAPASAEVIRAYVERGGAMLLLLNAGPTLTAWETSWLPVQLGDLRAANSPAGEHVLRINYRHSLLQVFSRQDGGDLFRTAVHRWHAFSGPTIQPLMSLPNGDPILATTSYGKGRLVIFAFPFTSEWSDLPVQSTFLPLIHETIKYLEIAPSDTQGCLVGDPGLLALAASPGVPPVVPGFVEIPAAADAPARTVAVNLDPQESDLARWTLLDNFARLTNPQAPPPVLSSAQDASPTDPDHQRRLWYLLLAAITLSLTELLLANRTPR